MSNQQSMMPDDERVRVGKVTKLVEVWYRASNGRGSLFFRDWVRFGRYKNEAVAQEVLRQKSGDRWFEYEVRT